MEGFFPLGIYLLVFVIAGYQLCKLVHDIHSGDVLYKEPQVLEIKEGLENEIKNLNFKVEILQHKLTESSEYNSKLSKKIQAIREEKKLDPLKVKNLSEIALKNFV